MTLPGRAERLQADVERLADNPELVEAAAAEAFMVDDLGGHHAVGRQPHTWQNIPEQGRENYRTLVRAVLTVVSRALSQPAANTTEERTDG